MRGSDEDEDDDDDDDEEEEEDAKRGCRERRAGLRVV